MDYYLNGEVKGLKECKPEFGDKFELCDEEYTSLSDIKNINKVIPVGTQLYYTKYNGDLAQRFKKTFNWSGDIPAVRYTSGGWDRVEVLKVKTKDIIQMKYEDKWRLNDGKTAIPADADTLTKDGSVVAYRLPIKEPKVGDMVQIKNSSGNKYKLLYIHQEEFGIKWAVIVGNSRSPFSINFEYLDVAD